MALFNPSASPAVVIREVDLTGGAPNVQSTTGVFVGDFNWGPAAERKLISSEAVLASTFTNPNKTNARDFISAALFLTYSQALYVTRAIDDNAANAYTDTMYGTFSYTDAVGGAEFSITATNGAYDVTVVDGGANYNVNDKITVTGDLLGGTTPANDLVITVATENANVIDTVTVTGTPNPTQIVVENEDDFNFQQGSDTLSATSFVARYPGTLGNSLSVEIVTEDITTQNWTAWSANGYFDGIPGAGQVHVVIRDNGTVLDDGTSISFAGGDGVVLETFSYVSTDPNARTDTGLSNYIIDVINKKSKYVYLTGTLTLAAQPDVVEYTFDNGADTVDLTEAEYMTSFDLYSDVDTVVVDFLIAPALSDNLAHYTLVKDLVALAVARADCMVVASPSFADMDYKDPQQMVDAMIATSANYDRSSRLVVDNNHLKVYDKYNDQYIYVPAASSTAGLMAATDLNAAPWFSPAGQRRGGYLGITSIKYSPTKAQRDQLYKAGINPIANIPGQGVLLYGDKTFDSKNSSFDRINVRRLFLVLERSIGQAAKNVIFEINDEFTRAEFVNIVEPLLREVQGRRGITDFRVICDETNNTPEVIDRNEFVASIFIKPARSINYVTLNFVAVRTGVSFEEVAGAV